MRLSDCVIAAELAGLKSELTCEGVMHCNVRGCLLGQKSLMSNSVHHSTPNAQQETQAVLVALSIVPC